MNERSRPPASAQDDEPERWGLECRLRAGVLDYHVPEGFRVSAAHREMIAYLHQIAAELGRLPHRYGYDPAGSYRILAQTWDRALIPVRSLAFGRNVHGQEPVGLIPDAYYIASDGYSDLYQLSLVLPAWSQREARVVWRGSVTGGGPFATAADIPRVQFALACRDVAGTDVALTNVHETLSADRDQVHRFLADQALLGEGWPMPAFSRFRFTFDIDGHANAWGLLEKLILGCCVLKVESPFEQWYYSRLHPWEHYIPIASDLSDLAERVQWCRDNDEQCRWIAANGMRLAATLRLHAELPRSCLDFMTVATAHFAPGEAG